MTKSPTEITVTLPRPPSVNSAFGNRRTGQKGKGRYATPQLIAWRKAAGLALLAVQPMPRIIKPVEIQIKVSETGLDNRHRDCANFEKVLTDFLVQVGVLIDDSRKFVRKVSTEWSGGEAGTVTVILTEVDVSHETVAKAHPPKVGHGKSWAMAQIKKKYGIDLPPERIHLNGAR